MFTHKHWLRRAYAEAEGWTLDETAVAPPVVIFRTKTDHIVPQVLAARRWRDERGERKAVAPLVVISELKQCTLSRRFRLLRDRGTGAARERRWRLWWLFCELKQITFVRQVLAAPRWRGERGERTAVAPLVVILRTKTDHIVPQVLAAQRWRDGRGERTAEAPLVVTFRTKTDHICTAGFGCSEMEGRARRENGGGGGGGADCRWNCTGGKDCLTPGLKTADGQELEEKEEMEEKVEEMMVKEGEDYYMEMGEEEDLSGE